MSSKTKAPSASERLLSGLGFAARAGRLRIGVDAVGRSIRRGEARAVVIAGDAPERVWNSIVRLVEAGRPPIIKVLDGDRLGHAVGRERVVAIAVTDVSLGRRVVELAKVVNS